MGFREQSLDVGAPVPLRCARKNVEHLVHERVPQFRVVKILEHVYADALRRQQADNSAHSVDAAGVHPGRVAMIVLHEPTETVVQEIRVHQAESGIQLHRYTDLRRDHLSECRSRNEPLVADPAAVEHEAHPFGHVRHARPHRPGRRDQVSASDRYHSHSVVRLGVWHCKIRLPRQLRYQRDALCHSKRFENARLDERCPRCARNPLDDVSADRIYNVLVIPL